MMLRRLFPLLPLVLAGGCAAHSPQAQPGPMRVILDTDANNELDDQHAIAYLLLNGDAFEVEGITVNRTRGGGGLAQHMAEAERVVRLVGLGGEVPVIAGADGSFDEIEPHVDQPGFDGSAAVEFIIERAHASRGGKLLLLPIGKLTNVALALRKDPSIAPRVRIVWLGSNYPEPGEYNQENDEAALNFLLDQEVELEIALVRYGTGSGTDAVRVTREEIRRRMAGKGPRVRTPVQGRNGGEFSTFGDYSVDLFEHIQLDGDPPSRALFDMAAVAIVKNPEWATRVRIPAPRLVEGRWVERPGNSRTVTLWQDFDRDAIVEDFFERMERYELAGAAGRPASPPRPAGVTAPSPRDNMPASETRPFDSGHAPVNGIRMYYEQHGRRDGPPLVLLHGGGSTIDVTFGRVLPIFARSRRVIAVEEQGHGRSSDRDAPVAFDTSADDVAALLGHLGVAQADILGFSNGASVALQVAIRHPERVRRLVFASSMTRRDGAHPELWEFMRQADFSNMPQPLKDAFLSVNPDPQQLRRMHDKDAARMQSFPDVPDALVAGVRARTLVLVGDRDIVRPEHALELTRLIEGARLLIVPGGHGDYLGELVATQGESAYPELTARLIEEFLDAP